MKEGSLKQMHHTQKLGPESFNSGSIKNDGSLKSGQENNSSPDFKKAHSQKTSEQQDFYEDYSNRIHPKGDV